jgi:threonine dehydrogenase-like Zn-dependent dehydrogenase
MMKAVQIVAPGETALVDVPRPVPGPGEVLVRIEGVTTCPHWDLHALSGEDMFPGVPFAYPQPPGQPGHELVGRVEEVADGVTTLQQGTRVAAWVDPGHDVPGAYAEFVARRERDLLAVPDDLPREALAPLELAMCVQVAFDSLARLDAVRGRRIGVSGIGGAGLVALQLARAAGAREVICFDLSPSRRDQALALGADAAFDPRELDPLPSRAGDVPGALVLDSAIDCSGSAAAVQFLLDRTRLAVGLFGVLREEVRFGFRHFGGPSLLAYGAHNRDAAEAALRAIIAGRLDLRPLVSRTLPFREYEQGIALLAEQRATKICFVP